MAKIINLTIENYRGIAELRLPIDKNVVCLVGRGDSGKTTVLDAIQSVLSPAWNLSFNDTDFHDCDLRKCICISTTVTSLPEKLITESRYGMFIKGYNEETGEIFDELEDGHKPALKIVLSVDKSLEPKWSVVGGAEEAEKPISAGDRSLLNCFKVADFVDSHFSWNKGAPLYSLLKSLEEGENDGSEAPIILEAMRNAKKAIDNDGFENLKKATEEIVGKAASFGLDISETATTIDVRDLSIRDGKVCLHENSIPFRLKGKGSKRLASIAIQSALARQGGIMLIDEIEQGLEPDRIKQVVRTLKEENEGQIFVTTHSRDAVCELEASDLCLLLKDKEGQKVEYRKIAYEREDLRKVVRACPEAFFAKKVIVCEGRTEIGICRALDANRKANDKSLMAFKDCAYIDGSGSEFIVRNKEIKRAGINVGVLCDSDVQAVNDEKPGLKELGINIFDCENGFSIERQVFVDLPWNGIQKLVEYVINDKGQSKKAFENELKGKYDGELSDDWLENDTQKTRDALLMLANPEKKGEKKSAWFKRIDHGQFLGNVIFGCFNGMGDEKHLKKMFTDLSNWIDG